MDTFPVVVYSCIANRSPANALQDPSAWHPLLFPLAAALVAALAFPAAASVARPHAALAPALPAAAAGAAEQAAGASSALQRLAAVGGSCRVVSKSLSPSSSGCREARHRYRLLAQHLRIGGVDAIVVSVKQGKGGCQTHNNAQRCRACTRLLCGEEQRLWPIESIPSNP